MLCEFLRKKCPRSTCMHKTKMFHVKHFWNNSKLLQRHLFVDLRVIPHTGMESDASIAAAQIEAPTTRFLVARLLTCQFHSEITRGSKHDSAGRRQQVLRRLDRHRQRFRDDSWRQND